MKPVIAIVGRPNVGKSTLFNKLAGRRVSIVEDTPGVTRDRIYCDAVWNGRPLLLIDTGGIEPGSDEDIPHSMAEQANLAVEAADVIVFVLDLNDGVTSDDREIAETLKRCGKPVIPAVNKVDSAGDTPAAFYEFYELGFAEDPIPVSSLQGNGTGELLDRITELCPADKYPDVPKNPDRISVCVIGRPNVGKSSLVNRLIGSDRMIVSNRAGTTRDAVDIDVDNDYGSFTFIDTAGIRRAAKMDSKIERWCVLRAKMAVDRADVCLIVIDGSQGVTELDAHIAGIAHEAGKASIIVVNKWDIVQKTADTAAAYENDIRLALSYMTYAPIAYVSALTGQRADKLFEMIKYVSAQSQIRITTGVLNDALTDMVTRVQPPSDKGRRLRVYYMTQTGTKPPTFVLFCNDADLFHFSYQRYIENCLREVFGLKGTPIKLVIKQRGETDDVSQT